MDIDRPNTPPPTRAVTPLTVEYTGDDDGMGDDGTPPPSHTETPPTRILSPSSRAWAAEVSPQMSPQPMDESGGSAIRNISTNLLDQQIMDTFYLESQDINDYIRSISKSYFEKKKELSALQQKHRIKISREINIKVQLLISEMEEIEITIERHQLHQEEIRRELDTTGQTGTLELSFDMLGSGIKSKKKRSKKRKSKKKSKKKSNKKKSKKKRSKKKGRKKRKSKRR